MRNSQLGHIPQTHSVTTHNDITLAKRYQGIQGGCGEGYWQMRASTPTPTLTPGPPAVVAIITRHYIIRSKRILIWL